MIECAFEAASNACDMRLESIPSKVGLTIFIACSKPEIFASALLSSSEISCSDGILAQIASVDLSWEKHGSPTSRTVASQIFIFQPPRPSRICLSYRVSVRYSSTAGGSVSLHPLAACPLAKDASRSKARSRLNHGLIRQNFHDVTGPRSVAMESHRAKVYHLGRLSQGCITGGFERLFG
jgi:hypothetical protein